MPISNNKKFDEPHPDRQSTPRRRLREAKLFDLNVQKSLLLNNATPVIPTSTNSITKDEMQLTSKKISQRTIDDAIKGLLQNGSN